MAPGSNAATPVLRHHWAANGASVATKGAHRLVVANHFDADPHSSTCRHCEACVETTDVAALRRHLGTCVRLSPDDRSALDEAARCEAMEGLRNFASWQHADAFDVIGWERAECQSCRRVVAGPITDLNRHWRRCSSGSSATQE